MADIVKLLKHVGGLLVPFVDSGTKENDFEVTLRDCLEALNQARAHSFYSVANFETASYFKQARVDEGDLNWVIPGLVMALSSPTSHSCDGGLKPSFFARVFSESNVKILIRLNERLYRDSEFER